MKSKDKSSNESEEMHNLSPELVAIAGRPDTVIFVGSGVSVWAGLPSWRQLIENLTARMEDLNLPTDLIRRELNNNDLLQAASYGLDKLTQQQRSDFLRHSCAVGDAQPADIHSILMSWENNCYITTNYDTLLETAIRQQRPGSAFEVVTPSQEWEVASLQQARASNFVFKPHGDIGDTAKIVITREEYSILKNERKNVFSTYRMLLTSRPVIYIGFGLRDPDFLLLKESIASDFGGSPQDHYAIMPDVSGDEAEYWRRNYGIHIVSYATDAEAKGPLGQHEPLLELLAEVGAQLKANRPLPTPTLEVSSAKETLALARHARRLRTKYIPGASQNVGEVLPVKLVVERSVNTSPSIWWLERSVASSALSEFSGKCVVDGAPGAGKTFVLESALRARAEKLEDLCLDPNSDLSSLRVPVYAALSQYSGNILDTLESSLPSDLSFKELHSAGRLVIFMDAFNEIPSHFLESGRAAEDIANLLESSGENTIVITTRFGSEIESLNLPVVHLDKIDRDYVVNSLAENSMGSPSFSDTLISVFQRPLFFQQYRAGVIMPAGITNVHDVYSQLIAYYTQKASEELGIDVPLDQALSFVGFQMVDAGDLSLGVTDLHSQLRRSLPTGLNPGVLISWLLKQDLLIPLPNKRVMFSHHSFPEYFAAYRLATIYASDASAPEACFGKKRWDQAVLLTLGFLSHDNAQSLLERIFEVDAQMGMRSLNYVETNSSGWMNYGLQIVHNHHEAHRDSRWSLSLDFELRQLVLDVTALPALWALTEQGDSLGGVAAAKIWSIGSSSDRETLVKHISERDDYNYLNRFAENIVDSLSEDDALVFLIEANNIDASPDVFSDDMDTYAAARSAVGTLLSGTAFEKILGILAQLPSPSPILEQIVLQKCYDDYSSPALSYTINAVSRDVPGAIFSLHMQLMYAELESDLISQITDPEVLSRVFTELEANEWAVKLVQQIAALDPLFSSRIHDIPRNRDPITDVIWLYLLGDHSGFMNGVSQLLDNQFQWTPQARSLMAALDVDWIGNEAILAKLFFCEDIELSFSVAQTISRHTQIETSTHQRQPVSNIVPFIERMTPHLINPRKGAQEALWLTAFLIDEDALKELSQLVSKGSVPQRRVVAHGILSQVPGFSLDELPSETIEWMVNDLGQWIPGWHLSNLLGSGNETLISDKLLPLLLDDIDLAAREELLDILKVAGARHGRRYVDESGGLLI